MEAFRMFIDLKHESLKELNFSINIEETNELELESRYTFNIDYDKDLSSFIATLIHETRDTKHNNEFNIFVKLIGYFVCEGITDSYSKQEAHIQAYTLLFPYVQSIIANLTMNAGLPPLMIPRANITTDNIEVK